MKAKKIIEKLCYDSGVAEDSNVVEYAPDGDKPNWEYIDQMFGETSSVIGHLENGSYLYMYSDSHNVMTDVMPDVIVCLKDGHCMFLYKIE